MAQMQLEAATEQQVLLVVDDREENLVAMEALLGDGQWNVRTVDSGEAALRCLMEEDVGLVLLDVQMPELDGFEVATMLKADPVTAAIPIIMVSAHEGRGARLIGLESGAEDYLSKPVDPAELIAKIRNLLLLRDRTIHSALH